MSDSYSSFLPTSQSAKYFNQANQPANGQNQTKKNGSDKATNKLIYGSESMSQLMKVVDRVAPSQANVLILGESGTGKELIAHALHEKSNRDKKPFVAINCGALRDSLLESELFGHEKGSFTGAFQKKIGLAEVADGGTLFLDEIGELASSVQAKLLRFLQEGEIYRVGGKESIKLDIRLICATNRDLDQAVRKNHFREDLFYRINTISLEVPPLRRRAEDIPILVNHFLSSSSKSMQSGTPVTLHPEAMELMKAYEWPGNVREVENICERLIILSDGHTIMVNDLPENISTPKTENPETVDYNPGITISELEKEYILKALHHFQGNKSQAAQALGITIKTLYNKLHDYGVFEKYSVHSRSAK